MDDPVGGRAAIAGQPVRPELDAEPSWPEAPAVPGAYVAPSIVPSAAARINGQPATATSIAAAAVAEGTVTSIPVAPRPDRWFSVPGPARDPSAAPGKAGLFSDLPFRTPNGVAAWAVAVGSLLGALAFLLPWAANGVIGAQNEPTYTGGWGLANPANLVLLALTLALLLLTLIPNPVPAAIRGAVLPLLIGGWLLGIVWTYATGPFGLGWGVDALAVGGIVLVLGGALSASRVVAADNHQKTAADPT